MAAVPAAGSAAASLRSIMHGWKREARLVGNAATGRSTFDEAAVGSALNRMIADAKNIQGGINAGSAEARDVKLRFAAFQTAAEAAVRDMRQRPALKADFSRMMDSCQSCHDRYRG